MNTRNAIVQPVIYAQAQPGKAHKAATGSTGHVERSTAHHYSVETITAMTLIGLLAVGAVVIFLLVCGALARYIVGGKRKREA